MTDAELTARFQAGPAANAPSVTVNATYGKANFTEARLTMSSWLIMPATAKMSFEKKSLLTAGLTKATKRLSRVSGTHGVGINGGFLSYETTVAEGAVICIEGHRTRRGSALHDGAIFFRARAAGPLMTVTGLVPNAKESVLGARVPVMTMRGDLLTQAELQVAGIMVPSYFKAANLDPVDIAALFEIDELAGALEDKPVLASVVNAQGKAEVVAVSAPPRRVIRVIR